MSKIIKKGLISLVFILIQVHNYAQLNDIVKEMTGLDLEFKMHIDSVKGFEVTDTVGIVEIGGKKCMVKQYFRSDSEFRYNYESMRTKFLCIIKDGDTNYMVLNFAFDHLAEVEIYRPNPRNKYGREKMAKFLGLNGWGGHDENGQTEYYINTRKKKDRYCYRYNLNGKYQRFIGTSKYAIAYFPLWCGTGKDKNWPEKFKKGMTK